MMDKLFIPTSLGVSSRSDVRLRPIIGRYVRRRMPGLGRGWPELLGVPCPPRGGQLDGQTTAEQAKLLL